MPSLTLKVFRNLLVPEGDVGFTVVDDRPKLGITAQVGHEGVHSFETLDEVDDAVLGRLLVESARSIVDCLSQYGWEADAHGCMGKGVFVIATIRGPRGVIWVDLDWTSMVAVQRAETRTLEGVLGHGALMSFLSGRWPRWRVTRDGGAEEGGPLAWETGVMGGSAWSEGAGVSGK